MKVRPKISLDSKKRIRMCSLSNLLSKSEPSVEERMVLVMAAEMGVGYATMAAIAMGLDADPILSRWHIPSVDYTSGQFDLTGLISN